MTFFDGIYPFYPQSKKPFVFDVDLIIVVIVFLVIAFSFLLILPGIRGRARLYWLVRVISSLFIGGVIVGKPVEQLNETINYNEEFSWWFGSDYDKEFEKGLQQGLPSPILYVAEKFTDHSPCGLNNVYRMAGHYASATLWVAFCAWLISNMLFSMPVPVYGGFMLLVTGAFLIFALLSFSTGRNAWCAIQFGLASLKLAYGASFWLTLATGLFCFLVGIVVIALHFIQPDLLKAFFDLAEDEEDDEGILGEVYVNPYFHQTQTLSSQPDFKLTIKNTKS
uniref:Dual oxidase maturation factor 1 n=1 Tax=Laticauda laticaudata TaxID=8630 RepID=A0A8C5SUE4_LATLA